jgi:hypothetical protein
LTEQYRYFFQKMDDATYSHGKVVTDKLTARTTLEPLAAWMKAGAEKLVAKLLNDPALLQTLAST